MMRTVLHLCVHFVTFTRQNPDTALTQRENGINKCVSLKFVSLVHISL